MMDAIQYLMSSDNQSQMKFNIVVNNDLMVGNITFQSYNQIHKILTTLQKIKLLLSVKKESVRYLTEDNVEVPADDTFISQFNPNLPINYVRVLVAEESIDLLYEKKRFLEYRQSRDLAKSSKFTKPDVLTDVANALQQIFVERQGIRDQKQLQKYGVTGAIKQMAFKFLVEIQRHKSMKIIYKGALGLFLNEGPSTQFNANQLEEFRFLSPSEKQQFSALLMSVKGCRLKMAQQKSDSKDAMNELKQRMLIMEVELQRWQTQKLKYLNEKVRLELSVEQQGRRWGQQKQSLLEMMQMMKQQSSQLKMGKRQLELTADNLRTEMDRQAINHNRRIASLEKECHAYLIKQKQNGFILNYYHSFMDKSLLIYQILSNQVLHSSFSNYLAHHIDPIHGLTLLYTFSKLQTNSANDLFHQLVDYKENILLIAKTVEGKLFGGFSNTPIAPKQHTLGGDLVKSFLFNVENGNLNKFPIKGNCWSVEYDDNFIVFGNEQICIDRLVGSASSLFVNAGQKSLHYGDPDNKKEYFLSDKKGTNEICVQTFQFYQIDH